MSILVCALSGTRTSLSPPCQELKLLSACNYDECAGCFAVRLPAPPILPVVPAALAIPGQTLAPSIPVLASNPHVRWLLIDGSNLAYRSHYAMEGQNFQSRKDGGPSGALHAWVDSATLMLVVFIQ